MITLNKLFKNSWQIYTKQFKTLFLITALTFLPIIIFQDLMEYYYENTLKTGEFSGIGLTLIALIVLTLFISFAGKGAIIKSIDSNKGIRKSLEFGWNNLISIIWVDILTSIFIIIGFILFIIPGIMFSVWYAFALMVLLLDNKKGWQALKQSKELTRGKWQGIFIRLILIYIILIAINVALSTISNLVSDNKIVINAIFYVTMLLFTPFIFSYTYVIYKNLKGGTHNGK